MAPTNALDAISNRLRSSQHSISANSSNIVRRAEPTPPNKQIAYDDQSDGQQMDALVLRDDDVEVIKSAHAQPVSATNKNGMVLDQALLEYLSETESELTDPSILTETDLGDQWLDLPDNEPEIIADPVAWRTLPAPTNEQFNFNLTSEHELTESDGNNDTRPKKRVKTDNINNQAVASTVPGFLNIESTAAYQPTELASPSALVEVSTSITTEDDRPSDSLLTNKILPPLLSPTLPPALEAFVATRQQHPFPPPPKFPQSLKMTIVPSSEYDTLKSHNSILRSHNTSLAKQNAALRIDNFRAEQIYEEVKETGPLDHGGCVLKTDYDELEAENITIRDENARLRQDYQLVKQCGYEWARLANLWDVEKQLFQNEVQGLLDQVNNAALTVQQYAGREQQYAHRLTELEGQVKMADQMLGRARLAIQHERARAGALVAQINQTQTAANPSKNTGFGGSGASYPEL